MLNRIVVITTICIRGKGAKWWGGGNQKAQSARCQAHRSMLRILQFIQAAKREKDNPEIPTKKKIQKSAVRENANYVIWKCEDNVELFAYGKENLFFLPHPFFRSFFMLICFFNHYQIKLTLCMRPGILLTIFITFTSVLQCENHTQIESAFISGQHLLHLKFQLGQRIHNWIDSQKPTLLRTLDVD